MTNFTDILYEKHHRVRGAAWITINRPEVMNAFTGHTLTEMRDAVEAASGDPEVGVVVITGAGDRAFCAGGDVRWLQEIQREGAASAAPVDPHAGIEDCLKPVIARVNGYSVGGGNHLAYFADFTIASKRATFAQVGPRVGSPASGYFVAYLTHVVGAKKAKEIWMLCRRYTAQDAFEMGLVNAVVPHDKLDDEVDRWCEARQEPELPEDPQGLFPHPLPAASRGLPPRLGRRDRPRVLPQRRGGRRQERLPRAPRARLLPLPALTLRLSSRRRPPPDPAPRWPFDA